MDVDEISQKMYKSFVEQKEKYIKETLLRYAQPKIKEPITKGKIKWRGIKLIEQPSDNRFWLEQRGKILGGS